MFYLLTTLNLVKLLSKETSKLLDNEFESHYYDNYRCMES